MKVLQVVTDDDRRGAQVFAMDLQTALARRGRNVRTVALASGSVGGLDVEVLGPSRLHPRALQRLRCLARSADVVVGHGSTTLPACAIAMLGTGVPFVYRQISDSLFWANTWMRQLRVRWALSRASKIVALWHGAADVLATRFGVGRDRIECIANGVPPEQFNVASEEDARRARCALGLDPEAPLIVYVGALVHEKGVDTAIDALAELPDVTLAIVGDGPQRMQLEQRARHLDGRARFLGTVNNVHRAFAAADVVVLPSRGGDSMPAVLIEAGLMGVPVVSTPIAAIPEIVVDGVTGFIVCPDNATLVATAVRKVISSGKLRRALGGSARQHCMAKFSIGEVADNWDRALADCARTYRLHSRG